jgi:hypothetical protein
MGVEPTTFCMARSGNRSRQLACVRSTRTATRFLPVERTAYANANERQVLPSLPRPGPSCAGRVSLLEAEVCGVRCGVRGAQGSTLLWCSLLQRRAVSPLAS